MDNTHKNTEEHVRKVCQELGDGGFVAFVGAGCSSPVGVSTWVELIGALRKGAGCDAQGVVGEAGEVDYPECAQELYAKFCDQGVESKYMEIIREAVELKTADWAQAHYEIVEATEKIVTTNFDMALENMVERVRAKAEVQILPAFNYREFLGSKGVIAYLHGKVHPGSRHDEIIFKTDEYKRFYPSMAKDGARQADTAEGGVRCLAEFIKNIYKECTLLFIGLSFKDEYLLESLVRVRKEIERDDLELAEHFHGWSGNIGKIRHYAFMRKPESKLGKRAAGKLDKKLASINVEVLRYDKHKDWLPWMRKVSGYKKIREENAPEDMFMPVQ